MAPDPMDLARWRADYALWHAALATLVEDLHHDLDGFVPMPPEAPAAPWQDLPAAPTVIDAGALVFEQRQKRPERAGPRRARPRHGKVRHVPLPSTLSSGG